MWIELGRLGAPYGIKGWIHVESYTDPPERLLQHREWVLRLSSGERQMRRVAAARAHAAGLVAHLEGVAGQREYYRADLIECSVRTLAGADLGKVSHFVDAPSGAVMVTKEAGGRQHWVLATPKHLREVRLTAHEGLVGWAGGGG